MSPLDRPRPESAPPSAPSSTSAPEPAVARGGRAPRGRLRRRIVLAVLLVLLAGGGLWYGTWWWQTGRFLEETDDAFTQADAVVVSPKVSGYVAEVAVGDNEPVTSGAVLVRIDDRDYRVARDRAAASLASNEARVRSIDAQLALQATTIAQARADVAAAEATLKFARQELDRYQGLRRTGYGTVQRAEQAEADIRSRQAALDHGRGALAAADQQLAVLRAAREQAVADRDAARAGLAQAELDLGHAVLRSPIAGAVGDRSVRAGQYVQPGARLLTVVPMGQAIYVVANFKETQLRRMFRGESAEIRADMLPDVVLHGHVDSLAPGTGAQFSLLPPENATGNFTKVVQRVPVRIVLEADAQAARLLRPGLSVTVEVDTRTAPPGPPQTLAAPRT